MDQASDEREYEDEILAEVVELEAESEEDYQRKLTQYKKQLEDWKLWRRKQVPTRALTSWFFNSKMYKKKSPQKSKWSVAHLFMLSVYDLKFMIS